MLTDVFERYLVTFLVNSVPLAMSNHFELHTYNLYSINSAGTKTSYHGHKNKKGHRLRNRRITGVPSGDVFQNPPKKRQRSKQQSQFPKDKLTHQHSRHKSYAKKARIFEELRLSSQVLQILKYHICAFWFSAKMLKDHNHINRNVKLSKYSSSNYLTSPMEETRK